MFPYSTNLFLDLLIYCNLRSFVAEHCYKVSFISIKQVRNSIDFLLCSLSVSNYKKTIMKRHMCNDVMSCVFQLKKLQLNLHLKRASIVLNMFLIFGQI